APIVVDRPTLSAANADSMSALMDPVFAQIIRARDQHPSAPTPAIRSKVTGGKADPLLGIRAVNVRGHYDLARGGPARLLRIAHNMVQVGRDLRVDETDFRRWVCMHEETHRVQFTAVPRLRTHLIEEARSLAAQMAPDPESLQERLQQLVSR